METFTEDSLVKLKVTELKEEIKKLCNVSRHRNSKKFEFQVRVRVF